MACVALSLGGFAVRGGLMMAGSPWLQSRFARIVPHVVDTILLASGLAAAAMLRQYPFVDGWLTAKVLGLLAYIGFGTMALKRARTRAQRIAFFALALLAAGYIVGVAFTKDAAWPVS
jgi:uncharacterized membrane protein SirB2